MAIPDPAERPSEYLEEIRRLLELNGENPFKTRAYEKASATVAGLAAGELAERARAGTLTELAGVGKGIAEVLAALVLEGSTAARDELKAKLPEGLAELCEVPGLGPKKARAVIDELGVRSVRELEYACRENRLLKLKGFGEKLQSKVLEGIRFMSASAGQQRLGDAWPVAKELFEAVSKALGPGSRVSEAGALRRRMETLTELELLCAAPEAGSVAPEARSGGGGGSRERVSGAVAAFGKSKPGVLPVRLHWASPGRFGYELARLTASPAHWAALGSPEPFDAPDEEAFYAKLGLPLIPPEARETGEEVAEARAGRLAGLLPWDGIQGVFHNHTVRSDGAATLDEMIAGAAARGYKYIGISDHSQSAFYAQGLKSADLAAQEREIREAQERHPGIRVFWGIESDVLADGSLDYPEKELKRFDFVIASIHSRFQMGREAMTDRWLAAIRNPYTRFVGHLTGRLLLGRPGYELDTERVIREAAAHDVAIEINAHPARLDIDWRWGPQLRAAGTKVSVNPDAHSVEGLDDVPFGVAMARKALLPAGLVVNSRPVAEVERWLARR